MSILKLKMLIKNGYHDTRDFGLRIGMAKSACILYDDALAYVQKKNTAILTKLRKDFDYLIKKYQPAEEASVATPNAPIWVLWWGGEMPDIIRACTKSKQRHANGHPVILLTKDNIKEYVTFSDDVWQQAENDHLRIAHLADMIRVQLIRRYGGIWLDASIYCAKDIPENAFCDPVFSLRGAPNAKFVSNNQWTTFAIGGYPNNVLCSFLDDFFQDYCATGKPFIDYFMFDCAIALAYHNIPAVRSSIDALPPSNNDCYWLDQHLDAPVFPGYQENLAVFNKIAWQRFRNNNPPAPSIFNDLFYEDINHG